jgi:small subunit ribosomal protein S6
MKNYELMVIIKPDIGIDDIEKRLQEIKELITSKDGEIYFEDIWGVRDFAYRIKKYDRGYYVIYNFKCDGKHIREFETTLKLENEVLRHMIVSLPEGYQPKSYLNLEEEAQEEQPEKKGRKKEQVAVVAAAAPVVKEQKPETKEEKPKETSMEDVDAKLKSIIDNPDLNF